MLCRHVYSPVAASLPDAGFGKKSDMPPPPKMPALKIVVGKSYSGPRLKVTLKRGRVLPGGHITNKALSLGARGPLVPSGEPS